MKLLKPVPVSLSTYYLLVFSIGMCGIGLENYYVNFSISLKAPFKPPTNEKNQFQIGNMHTYPYLDFKIPS